MDRRVLALALVVAVAGCGSLAGQSDSRETLTPAPVPSVTEGDVPLPPGVGPDGSIDAERLAAAHSEALVGRSYTRRITRRFADRERISTLRVENRTRYRYDHVRPGTGENATEFSDGADRYTRYKRFSPQYNREAATPVRDRHGELARRAIRDYLDLETAAVSTAVVDGERRYVVRGETDDYRGDEAANFSVRAVVGPVGLVYSLDVSYAERRGGEAVAVSYRHRYELEPVTVSRPGWVERNW
jgi:hypothetical protein